MEIIFAALPAILISLACLRVFHHFIKKNPIISTTTEWYILHLIVNASNVALCFHDTVKIITNPFEVARIIPSPLELIPTAITIALHLYHPLFFTNLALIDWVHHIVMIPLLILTIDYPYTKLVNYILFFVNGFPGGIDYLMLILVKFGYLGKLDEKGYNATLNLWIRGPGIMYGTSVIYIHWLYGIIPSNLTLLIIAGLFWNSQYFTGRVVSNYSQTSSKNES